MVLGNKISKFLIIIVLSILFISTKDTKVLADSKSPLDANKQIKFLEEKRISQGVILGERQRNAIVKGMLSSKDVEHRRNTEIEKENEIKRKQSDETDTFSQVVKSIRKSQSKKHQSKQVAHEKPVNQISRTNNYYKNTNIPIINDTRLKAERIQLSEPIADVISEIKENRVSNPLLGQVRTIKDLIDNPLPNREPVDMGYSDIEMLERIVMAESGGEPYLGQIAVANVVLSRVKSNRYPSTIGGVIFQKSQFSPVKNGVIRGRAPNESVKKAVAEALNGRMVVPEDTLYFVNPVLATDQTIPRTKTPVKVIGSHTFYK